jgi:tripartite-type tricarboxylate transporter receptor subunit TctC
MKSRPSRKWTRVWLAAPAICFALASSGPASGASPYPERPVTLVVPLAAGGTVDLQARVLAQAMEKELNQPVVVLNKPGGSMTVGGYAVASAKPDGYTIGLLTVGSSIPELFSFIQTPPYTSDDLRPICRIGTSVMAIAVRADAPWNSLKELVAYARNNPRMKYSHQGRGGTSHTAMSAIVMAEKLDMVDVPTDGDAAMLPALLGGHIPVGIPAYPAAKPLLEAKKIKVLALCIDKRAAFAPDIPTVVELGYKLPYIAYHSLFAPAKTGEEIIRKLDETARKVSEDKTYAEKITQMDGLVTYEDTASFERTVSRYKTDVRVFFKEQGLVQ